MSAVSWYAGEEWSDAPSCVCPTIRAVGIRLNDALPSDEAREEVLSPYVFRVMGTRNRVDMLKRARMCAAFAKVQAADAGAAADAAAYAAADAATGAAAYAAADAAAYAYTDAAADADAGAAAYAAAYAYTGQLERLLDLLCRVGVHEEVPQVRCFEDIPAYATKGTE
jgi:hypothetical protein